ncbi:MAG: hypothetical protein ACYDAD_11855, partial [Acidimicrobiales bacterium]
AGAVLTNGLSRRFASAFPGHPVRLADLMAPGANRPVPPAVAQVVRGVLAGALHDTFLACLVVGVVATLSVALVPRGRATDIRDRARAVAAG